MKPFLDEQFLLETKTAVTLYETAARGQPIIDYHCHLPPELIASNHRFATITQIWLNGDHYKWRAMRTDGVPERNITGEASDWEKFAAWAATVPHTLRNPLHHWTHMELRFPFGVRDVMLNPTTARAIYDRCNQRLAEDDFTTQGLLRQFNVVAVCSTDDPIDSLEPHRQHAANAQASTKLFPTWRPDKVLAFQDLEAWNRWADRLEAAAGVSVGSYDALLQALDRRHAVFHQLGCRASDHGLDCVWAVDYSAQDIALAFDKARSRKPLTPGEIEQLRSALLHDLAVMDHGRNWAQQYHLGALRNNSTRAMRAMGPDTGYDAIGDLPQAAALAKFLDRLDVAGQLAKTILYNLNPADNEVFASIAGCFQDGSAAGKIQYGAAWWFLDQLDGMRKQLDALSNLGLLWHFVGMLTDSRAFLSYSRHDYFRRLLCNMLANDVEQGLIPDDQALLCELVRNVCYGNALRYFGFPGLS